MRPVPDTIFERSLPLSEAKLAEYLNSLKTYMWLVADRELPDDVRAKVSPSDIIQDSFLEARRDAKRFRGESELDVRSWLRQILLNNIRDTVRRYQSRQKRQVSREVPIDSLAATNQSVAATTESPSRALTMREDAQRVHRALAQLSPEHGQVILLRSLERRSLQEVAQMMDRSEDAVRKLWVRALQHLQRILAADQASS